MWVHHGATLYCLLSLDLDYPHCALIACLELQCQSFFHCSYDFCRLGCEGGHIIVVANSTFKIRPVLKDLRSAREIARKGVSKIQIRYIYLDDANPVILSPAKRPRIFFSHHEASWERPWCQFMGPKSRSWKIEVNHCCHVASWEPPGYRVSRQKRLHPQHHSTTMVGGMVIFAGRGRMATETSHAEAWSAPSWQGAQTVQVFVYGWHISTNTKSLLDPQSCIFFSWCSLCLCFWMSYLLTLSHVCWVPSSMIANRGAARIKLGSAS
jgi:hypothetical protein